MILAVLADDQQKEEIAVSPFFNKHEVLYSENLSLWSNHIADAFFDLRFDFSADRIEKLSRLFPKPVFVNAVTATLDQLNPEFIRINGWPGFLKGKYVEASANASAQETVKGFFGDDFLFVKDQPGFVSARIVAMIINEAYFTSDAGVSTKEEIDTAMKLGTGYPLGPFEWGEKIGVSRVVELIEKLGGEIAHGLTSTLAH